MPEEQNEEEKSGQNATPAEAPKGDASALPSLPSWNVRGQFTRKSAAFTSGIRIPSMDPNLLRKETEPPVLPPNATSGLPGPSAARKHGGEDTIPPGALKKPVDLRSRNILPKPGSRPTLGKFQSDKDATKSRLPGPPLPNQQKITDPDLPVVASADSNSPAPPKPELQSTGLAKEMRKQRDTGELPPIPNGKGNGSKDHSHDDFEGSDSDRKSSRSNPLSKLGTSPFATGTKSSSFNQDAHAVSESAHQFSRGDQYKRTSVRELRYWGSRYRQKVIHLSIAVCVLIGIGILAVSILSDFLVFQAMQQWKLHNEDAARRNFDLAIMIEPNSFPARMKRARFNLETNKLDSAEGDLKIVLKKEPANVEALETQALWDLRKKNWQNAASEYSKLLSMPGKTQSRFLAGRAAARMQLGENKEALQDYSAALASEPDNLDYMKGYGYGLVATSQYEKAANILDTVLSKDPSCQEALVKRAWCLINQDSFAQAQECLDKAKELAPGDPQIYVCLGELSLKQNETDKAQDSFDTALKLDANTASAYQGKARLAQRSGDINSEYENSKKAFELLGKQNLADYLAIAKLAEADGKFEDAINYYTNALKANPNNPDLYGRRAAASERTGRYVGAIKDYDKLVSLSPGAKSFADRAYSNWQAGSRKSAEYDFETAIGREPHNYYPFFKRGLCYFKEGDFKNAANDFSNALKLKPDATEVRKYLQQTTSNAKPTLVEVPEQKVVSDKAISAKIAHLDLAQLLKLGYEQYTAGNLDNAIVVLRQAVRTNPNDPMARRYLAHALHESKRDVEAADQISALQSLKALGADEQLLAGDVFRNAGKTSEALSIFQKLVGEDSHNLKALNGLAQTYAKAGQLDQGKKLITDAISKSNSDAERDELNAMLKEL
jgi:tetratricopeptide (TPR) repeat protein